MNKAELIDAIASGSKLTKADAGRLSSGNAGYNPNPKATLAIVAATWNLLSIAQQESWNTAAVGFPAKNKYGDLYTPSGYQVFMKLNLNLLNINFPILRNAPIPEFPVCPPVNRTVSNIPQLLSFTFAGGIPEGVTIQVFACNQVLRGSGFKKGKEKQLISAPSNSTGVIDVTGAYQNMFGVAKANANIIFRFVPVSNTTGQAGVATVLPVIIDNYVASPLLHAFLNGVFLQGVSVGKNWIVPFRANGFELVAPLLIRTPIDPAGRFKISRSLTGPWVNEISIGLNEVRQPVQNVFYMRFQVAAPSLIGTNVTLDSTGANQVTIGFGGEAIDQFITLNPDPIAFGDVFSNVPTVQEVNVAYGALRDNVVFSLSGANVADFKISLTPNGPWLDSATIPVRGQGADAAAKVYIQVIGGALGAKTANLNYNTAADIAGVTVITANSIEGVLVSDNSPGDSFGDQAVGAPIEWDFGVSGSGLGSDAGIFTDNLVNCTVQYANLITGPWANISSAQRVGSNLPLTQRFFRAIPVAAGVFSWRINIVAGGTNLLQLDYDGVGV